MESSKEAFEKGSRSIRQPLPHKRPSSTAIRVGLIAVAIILCGALAYFFYIRKEQTNTSEKGYSAFSSTASAALPEMPANVTQADLRTVDGETLRLSSHAGKVVVIDLWATWCSPCRKEIPQLVQFNKDYKDRGVEVIGLTTEDPQAAAQKVRDFANEFHIDYTLGWAGAAAAALMQGNNNIPQKFVITRDGRLLKRFIGYNAQNGAAQLREAVDQALRLGIGEQASTELKPSPPAVPSDGVRRITVNELHDAVVRGEAVVLDVRPESQYKAGHIQGTLWIPDNEISKRYNEVPRDKLIATYCS
ncbi:MAG TPA: redoxin family protein [Pyrinomonadaceae bacterium]|nr:redoxin family protein [Pyrinomonadaceae bacterium]